MNIYTSAIVESPETELRYRRCREKEQLYEQRRITRQGHLQPLIGTSHPTAGIINRSLILDEGKQSKPQERQRKHTVNLSQGLFRLLERHELPQNADLESILTSDGPMRARRAPIHVINNKRNLITSTQIMTETSGFSKMKMYKLDYNEMAKLPSKLSVNELKEWEIEAAQEEAAARALIRAQQAEMQRLKQMDAAVELDDNAPTVSFATSTLPRRDDPRSYTELLDLYSMHEFIIRKGKTLRNTPEFASFKRHYKLSWGVIESCIEAFESFLNRYGVEVAYVDGKKLAVLASSAFTRSESMLSELDMVACIANAEEIYPLLGNSAHIYRYGSEGAHRAANKIQATWRMFKARIAYQHLLVGTRAAEIIQRAWALHQSHRATRHALESLRQTRLTRWRQTNERFATQWPELRTRKRLLIHIPSLSVPHFHSHHIPFYVAQQMAEIMRLSDLADPLLKMILVLPFKPESEVLEYYYTILNDMGVSNVTSRLTILTPEEAVRLPPQMSLARLTLLSSRLMKMLSALSVGIPTYIVPAIIGPDELSMCAELNIPLMGPEPRVAQVFGTKSGTKRLLEAAEVTTPLGATLLRSREDCLRALASLMVEHPHITRWLIKLETESGSRGHAYFDVSRMQSLRNLEHTVETANKPISPMLSCNVGINTQQRSNVNEETQNSAEFIITNAKLNRSPMTMTMTMTTKNTSPTTSTESVTTTTTFASSATNMQNGEVSKSAMKFDMVLKELNEFGAKRVRIINSGCYPTWSSYLDMLDNVGAVIEAVPSNIIANLAAHVFVEPDGEVHVESVVEQLLSPSFTVMSSCYPCTQPIPYFAIRDAAMSVGKAAFRKRIIGYLSVDFVLFCKNANVPHTYNWKDNVEEVDEVNLVNDNVNKTLNNEYEHEQAEVGKKGNKKVKMQSTKSHFRLWGVDVDLHRTNYASAHVFAMNLSQCKWNEELGICNAKNDASDDHNTVKSANVKEYTEEKQYQEDAKLHKGTSTTTIKSTDEKLYYVYSGLIYNPFIAAIRHSTFFTTCSYHGIAFDRVTRKGVVFQMPDVLLRSCLGVIAISDNRAECVKWMSEFQRLLHRELPRQGEHFVESNFVYFSSAIRQLDRVIRLPSTDVKELTKKE